MIVLDASAALELLLATSAGARIEERLFAGREAIHAPHLIDVEVAHALRRLALRGLDEAGCAAAYSDWWDVPVERTAHGILMDRAWALRANFTIYDGVYIALAELLDAPLVTHDAKLVSTAHRARVEVI